MIRSAAEISGFEHQPATQLVLGENVVERVVDCARELNATSVFVVSDPGVREAGHADRVEELLTAAGLNVTLFSDTHQNPTTDDVAACLRAARAMDPAPDVFVAVGGGSALDTAKGCNFLLTNGGEMQDYWGTDKAHTPLLPLVAIPTTAGTGSETQAYALIADAKTHQKMACGDKSALPRVALLDPVLTLTQPTYVASVSGLDAITHAVEAFVCTRRNEISNTYARESLRRTLPAFAAMLAEPLNLEARSDLILGAAYAGLAIQNSMLGGAHALANPMTAMFDVTHGHAVSMMLPHVIRFNAEDDATRANYESLARFVSLNGTEDLIETIKQRLQQAQLSLNPADVGVQRDAIPQLAEIAAKQWTAQFNPRPLDADNLAMLYQRACEEST